MIEFGDILKKIVLILFLFCIVHINALMMPLKDINQYLYNDTIYITYKNNTPYFYIGERKEFVVTPPYIKADEDLTPIIENLGFRVVNDSYNLIITTKDIDTDKMAIIFAPINGSKKICGTKRIIWVKDPLRLNYSEVEASYILPKKGEIIAKYEDGEPAAIKIDNKIYAGFKPNEEVLANLIYTQIVKKTSNPAVFFAVAVLVSLASVGVAFYGSIYGTLKKAVYKAVSALSAIKLFILARINVFDKDKVLDNPTRKEIYDYIAKNPGTHLKEISKNLNISTSTVTWHLKVLEKSDLIRSRKVGNKVIFYPAYLSLNDIPHIILKNETSKKIFNYLLKNPAHLRKIAKDLNLNVETVRYNLRKMETYNLVKSKEDGNRVVYYIDESVKAIFG